MNSIGNPLFMMGAIFAMRYVNLQDPKIVMYVKMAYITVQVATILVSLLIRKRITESKETGNVAVPESRGGTPQTVSVKEYDLSQIKQSLNQALIGTLITLFINYKWQVIQPLFIQSVLAPKNMLTSPLFRIYIMGDKATGKLARPFKSDNPLADLIKQVQQPAQEQPTQPETVADNGDDNNNNEDEAEDASTSSESKKAK